MKPNKLIADSGSTKTDWALGVKRLNTQGINPVHQDEDTIRRILRDELLPQLADARVTEIAFYGSGVRPELEAKMQRLLGEIFPSAMQIEAKSDLLGAARALCGHEEGIACILGTGANSCLFDGERIVSNTPSMGYILGDEGSGAVLGRQLLNRLYKNVLSDDIKALFEEEVGVKMSDVIERVYRQPLPNRWLASLSVFVHRHLDKPGMEALVVDNFRDFINRNILAYHRPDLPISAVGSIAYFFKPQLEQAAKEKGYAIGRIVRSPLDALVEQDTTA